MSEYQDDAVLQSLVKKRGIPARTTHMHACGHFDACYPKNVEEPCIECLRDAFNRAARRGIGQ